MGALQSRTLMGALKPSTRRLYASNGSVCEGVRLISTRLLAPYVLSFPLHRLDSGSFPSTLKSMSRPLPCPFPAERAIVRQKDYIPHVHFRFRSGTRKWGKSSLIATIWVLTSVGLKELFLKTTVLLAFASAKRIEHLHAFLWTAAVFDSVPGLQCHSPAEVGICA